MNDHDEIVKQLQDIYQLIKNIDIERNGLKKTREVSVEKMQKLVKELVGDTTTDDWDNCETSVELDVNYG